MKNKLFYLAAPYSSKDANITAERVQQVCIADAKLMTLDVYTVTPLLKHLVLQYSELPGTWAYWKTYSETLLAKCDGVIVLKLDGWDISDGVQAEISFAKKNNIPIQFCYPNEIELLILD